MFEDYFRGCTVAELQEDFELPQDKAEFEARQRAAARDHKMNCPVEIREQAAAIAEMLFARKV
jgi:hypothetical protein